MNISSKALTAIVIALVVSGTLAAQTTREKETTRRMETSSCQRQLKSRENPNHSKDRQLVTILEEDFSLFTAGSEEEPDGTNLTDPETYMVDPNYTHMPGWNGGHVFQAGGVCYFGDWYSYINTPEMEMSGNIHISFRARKDGAGQHQPSVGIAYDVDNPHIVDYTTFTITQEWQSFEFDFFNPESRDVFVQFNAYTEWFLDDVVIQRELNFVPAPTAYAATDYTMEGFDAHWGEVSSADKYLLTVFKRDFHGPEQVYAEPESFENLNNDGQWIDWSNPNIPEGWTLKLQSGDQREVTTDAYHGNLAICMDAEGDTIILPSNGGRYLSSNFALRVMENSMSDYSDLEIIGKKGAQWQYTGVFYWSTHIYSNHGNDWITDDLVSSLANEYDEIGLAYVGGGVVWALDYWDYTTNQASTVNTLIADLEVPATSLSYTVTGLNPAEDHYYYVKAANDEYGVSVASNYINCFGLCPPIIGEASNVGDGTYTANWEAHPKADAYEIHNYKVYTAPTDETGHVVFSEDFSKVQNGMPPETPVPADNPLLFRLDEFTTQPDWTGAGVVLADGMLGAKDNEYYYGRVTTPEITLSNAATFHVKTSIYCNEGETIDIIAMTTQETHQFTYTATGLQTLEMDFTAGPDSDRERLKIMDETGAAFLVDAIQVTQDLHAGDKTFGIVSWDLIEDGAAENYTYTGLDIYGTEDFAYDLIAIHTAFDDDYPSVNSDYSAMVSVPLGTIEVSEDEDITIYPNPANEKIILGAEMASVRIYDMKGSLVLSLSNVGEINVSAFPEGLYMLNLRNTEGRHFSKEIVVKH